MTEEKLRIGDPAPDFELIGDDGARVRLSDLRGRRVVLYFYPADFTPGCTTQACGFRDAYPQIEAENAVVLGISPDGFESHRKFKAKYRLPFRLLADPEHHVAGMYGVWDGERIARSHFVVDEQGRLADARVKVSPEDSVRTALESLRVKVP